MAAAIAATPVYAYASETDGSGENVSVEVENVDTGSAESESGETVTEANGSAETGTVETGNVETESAEAVTEESGSVESDTGETASGETESSSDDWLEVITSDDEEGQDTATGTADTSETINADDNVKFEAGDVPYIAFGADLTADQKQKVLDLMGLKDADISGYDMVTVTNEEEHQYLDDYIDPAKIGTKALSSVLILKGEPDSGISVSTKNINYCTVGMYKNALATAGLTDAQVIVAGPFELSGTAALIGAMKAYSEMTGETVDTEALDVALDELVITGSVREKYDDLSAGEAEELIAYLKGKVLSENLTEDQMKSLIKEGAAQYGVELDDSEITQIVGFLDKLKGVDIDTDEIMGYAEDLYNKFKDVEIDEETQNLFLKILNAIIEFFRKLFGAE